MCGIVGYVGQQQAAPLLLDGLCRLEYRGYDSAGIAVCGPEGLQVRKTPGRLAALETLTHGGADLPGTVGIGHTRWATHGEPNQVNAHPQVSGDGKFAVVHNGIIENFARLKQELIQKGCTFVSETDTEVVAQRVWPMPTVPVRLVPPWVSSSNALRRPGVLRTCKPPAPHTATPAES